MSGQLFDSGSERARGTPAAPDAVGPAGAVGAGVLCECMAMSLSSPAGEVIVVRVTGEVDLCTGAVVRDALADSLARGPCDLLVDLAAMTFCDVRGLALFVQTGPAAAERGIGYGVAAAPGQARRVWAALWPGGELPAQFPSSAAGVLAAMAAQADDDLARWAPKRGPGWVRRWSTPQPAGTAHAAAPDHEAGSGRSRTSRPAPRG